MTDLEMMRDPDSWPNLVLPLINRKHFPYDKHQGEGILWFPIGINKKKAKYSFLAGHNMFDPIPEDAQWIRGGDELLVKLISEGWEVD